jgi:hypothetical protein
MALSRACCYSVRSRELSLDSHSGAAMVDVLNLPDRFGQWQTAITLRHSAHRRD